MPPGKEIHIRTIQIPAISIALYKNAKEKYDIALERFAGAPLEPGAFERVKAAERELEGNAFGLAEFVSQVADDRTTRS